MRLILLNLLFLVAAGGAWAWYHVQPPEPPVRYAFTARPEVPGRRFAPEPVGEIAAQILATTNLLNGTFFGPDNLRVTAFMGSWSAENSKEMSVVSHTPDICWVGAGWTTVMGNHPDRTDLEWDGTRIPFECRLFRAPGDHHEEFTVWCTLVNGRVTGETGRFVAALDPSAGSLERQARPSRRLAANQFLDALSHRSAGTGDKQFVRFSTRFNGDWPKSLRELQSFGQQWLILVTNPPVTGKSPRR